jgi:hypothetical protein
MGGHHFPEIPCALCSKTLDLQTDLCADENGKAVHEECYVKRITTPQTVPSVTAPTIDFKTSRYLNLHP